MAFKIIMNFSLTEAASANVSAATLGNAVTAAVLNSIPADERSATSVSVTIDESSRLVFSVPTELTGPDLQALKEAIIAEVCGETISCDVTVSVDSRRRLLGATRAVRSLSDGTTVTATVVREYAFQDGGNSTAPPINGTAIASSLEAEAGMAVTLDEAVQTAISATANVETMASMQASTVDDQVSATTIAASVSASIGTNDITVSEIQLAPPPPPPPPPSSPPHPTASPTTAPSSTSVSPGDQGTTGSGGTGLGPALYGGIGGGVCLLGCVCLVLWWRRSSRDRQQATKVPPGIRPTIAARVRGITIGDRGSFMPRPSALSKGMHWRPSASTEEAAGPKTDIKRMGPADMTKNYGHHTNYGRPYSPPPDKARWVHLRGRPDPTNKVECSNEQGRMRSETNDGFARASYAETSDRFSDQPGLALGVPDRRSAYQGEHEPSTARSRPDRAPRRATLPIDQTRPDRTVSGTNGERLSRRPSCDPVHPPGVGGSSSPRERISRRPSLDPARLPPPSALVSGRHSSEDLGSPAPPQPYKPPMTSATSFLERVHPSKRPQKPASPREPQRQPPVAEHGGSSPALHTVKL